MSKPRSSYTCKSNEIHFLSLIHSSIHSLIFFQRNRLSKPKATRARANTHTHRPPTHTLRVHRNDKAFCAASLFGYVSISFPLFSFAAFDQNLFNTVLLSSHTIYRPPNISGPRAGRGEQTSSKVIVVCFARQSGITRRGAGRTVRTCSQSLQFF